jgi:hypothetical protein
VPKSFVNALSLEERKKEEREREKKREKEKKEQNETKTHPPYSLDGRFQTRG